MSNPANPFKNTTSQLLNANAGANIVYLLTEGILVSTHYVVYNTIALNTGNYLQYNINNFGCGIVSAIYLSTAPLIIDTFACADGTPVVTFLALAPTTRTVVEVIKCSVSAQTALNYAEFSQQDNGAIPLGQNFNNIGQVVNFTGQVFWNNFGTKGSKELYEAFVAGSGQGFTPTNIAQITVNSGMKSSLVKISDILQQQANTYILNPPPPHNE